MNTTTPRVFLAATAQNAGKTTVALGLFATLRKRFERIGFIKPVGQRFVDVEGHRIDEDSLLMENTFRVQVPIEAMSPIAVEPDFTRRYIEHANNEALVRRIQNSFDRACWEKDFAIIEGTGHAGVGAVFDLSNARVAKLLESKVILVSEGGIGRPIDEIALNRAVFDQEGVELIGVVLNKVVPEKFEAVDNFARRGLKRLGIELLGVLPSRPVLAEPTLQQICEHIGGSFLQGENKKRRRVSNIVIGGTTSRHSLENLPPSALVITAGERDDVIQRVLDGSSVEGAGGKRLAGLLLSGDSQPTDGARDAIRASELPVLTSELDSYTLARCIYSMTIKTLPGDHERIDVIQQLVEEHVDVERIVEKITARA